jgi:hypothetical protein
VWKARRSAARHSFPWGKNQRPRMPTDDEAMRPREIRALKIAILVVSWSPPSARRGSRSRTSRREAMTGSNGLDRSRKCAPAGDPECSLKRGTHQTPPPSNRARLRAGPRSFQVTPDIPDRRRATPQKEVRPPAGRQPQRESARRRSGPSPQRRTSPTKRDHNSKPQKGTTACVVPHSRGSRHYVPLHGVSEPVGVVGGSDARRSFRRSPDDGRPIAAL